MIYAIEDIWRDIEEMENVPDWNTLSVLSDMFEEKGERLIALTLRRMVQNKYFCKYPNTSYHWNNGSIDTAIGNQLPMRIFKHLPKDMTLYLPYDSKKSFTPMKTAVMLYKNTRKCIEALSVALLATGEIE